MVLDTWSDVIGAQDIEYKWVAIVCWCYGIKEAHLTMIPNGLF